MPLFRPQTVLNELMHKVAHDREFLTATLAQTIKVDDFTGRLFKIFETVWDEGLAQVRSCAAYTYSSTVVVRDQLIVIKEFNNVVELLPELNLPKR